MLKRGRERERERKREREGNTELTIDLCISGQPEQLRFPNRGDLQLARQRN